jgi:putative membrane protein insertion efficiency factor
MHYLLPLERLASHAPGDHDTESHRRRCGSQSHPAAAQGGFPAKPSGYPRGMGYRSKPSPFGGGASVPSSRERDFATVSGRSALRFELVRAASGLMQSAALALIRIYQVLISPALPSSCRFYPTCSAYAYEAVEKWGVGRGTWLALRRLVRCRPWGGRGVDPVP